MKESKKPTAPARAFASARYLFALACVAIACGAIGAAFTVLLEAVERLTFGFTTGTLAEAVTQVSPLHRFLALAIGGTVIAITWYALRKLGPRIPSVDDIARGDKAAPSWVLADTVLQVVNVGIGASIGREGAPRQAGALAGALSAERLGLPMELRRVLAACGAGAGLASIYNVPFGGACFAIEVVLGVSLLARAKVDAAAAIGSAVACSWGATVIARVVVPDRPTYTLDVPTWDAALMMCAAVAGPILGVIGHRFGALVDCARQRAARGTQILWRMPVGYVLLGLLAIPFPLILGNGHAMAQNLFAAAVPIGTAVALAVAKPVATLVTILTGATGGRLTPSLATGAALALCFGTLAALALPIQPSSAAVVGAAAFLAGAMRAPLTAGILAIEFTGATSMSPAVAIAVGGAWAVLRVMGRGRDEGS